MNMNVYPQNTSETLPPTPEQEYRAELQASIIAESTGNVALMTSMDLDPEEVDQLDQAFADRNPGKVRDMRFGHGGWGEYGERESHAAIDSSSPNKKLLEARTQAANDREEVAFVKNGEETLINYRFMPSREDESGYPDASGRPGNALNLSFSLPPERAAELQDALRNDPSYMQDIIAAQLVAIGLSRRQQVNLQPHIGFEGGLSKIPGHELAMTSAEANGERTLEHVAYADKQPMAPAQAVDAEPTDLELWAANDARSRAKLAGMMESIADRHPAEQFTLLRNQLENYPTDEYGDFNGTLEDESDFMHLKLTVDKMTKLAAAEQVAAQQATEARQEVQQALSEQIIDAEPTDLELWAANDARSRAKLAGMMESIADNPLPEQLAILRGHLERNYPTDEYGDFNGTLEDESDFIHLKLTVEKMTKLAAAEQVAAQPVSSPASEARLEVQRAFSEQPSIDSALVETQSIESSPDQSTTSRVGMTVRHQGIYAQVVNEYALGNATGTQMSILRAPDGSEVHVKSSVLETE